MKEPVVSIPDKIESGTALQPSEVNGKPSPANDGSSNRTPQNEEFGVKSNLSNLAPETPSYQRTNLAITHSSSSPQKRMNGSPISGDTPTEQLSTTSTRNMASRNMKEKFKARRKVKPLSREEALNSIAPLQSATTIASSEGKEHEVAGEDKEMAMPANFTQSPSSNQKKHDGDPKELASSVSSRITTTSAQPTYLRPTASSARRAVALSVVPKKGTSVPENPNRSVALGRPQSSPSSALSFSRNSVPTTTLREPDFKGQGYMRATIASLGKRVKQSALPKQEQANSPKKTS